MEGISSEAASLAGHLGLGKLIGIYDHNSISLDGPTSAVVHGERAGAVRRRHGWRVLEIADGNDLAEIDAILSDGLHRRTVGRR